MTEPNSRISSAIFLTTKPYSHAVPYNVLHNPNISIDPSCFGNKLLFSELASNTNETIMEIILSEPHCISESEIVEAITVNQDLSN